MDDGRNGERLYVNRFRRFQVRIKGEWWDVVATALTIRLYRGRETLFVTWVKALDWVRRHLALETRESESDRPVPGLGPDGQPDHNRLGRDAHNFT